MNVLEYVLISTLYLFSFALVLIGINGFMIDGVTTLNYLLLASGGIGMLIDGHTLLTNPVNWYEDVF